MTPSRRREAGLARGCCLGVVLLAVLAIAGGLAGSRLLATPDLGQDPGGPEDGATQEAIAGVLAVRVAAGLVASPHTVVTVSERDLTVIAGARNPEPDRFREPRARVRDGKIVVSARSSLGPFDVIPVADISVSLVGPGTDAARLIAHVDDLQIGNLGVPSWARGVYEPRAVRPFSLDAILNANPSLEIARRNLECLSVQVDGVHLGFHRPLVPAQPAACG